MYLWDEDSSTVTILECYAKPQKTNLISAEINKLSEEYAVDRTARDSEKETDIVSSDAKP